VLARHAGASRFAFNQCLRTVKTALTERRRDANVEVPWSGFDLINTFNAWKKTERAGRVIAVGVDGVGEVVVTGLSWRDHVCQQVFEEAAVDCGRALAAWSDSRSGKRRGKRVGFLALSAKSTPVNRFGCAISTRKVENRRSGSAITIVHDSLPCPASEPSAYTTTPVGCAECWAMAAPKSASPLCRTSAAGGGWRSMSRPPACIRTVSTRHGT
jgi:hypothetical protein